MYSKTLILLIALQLSALGAGCDDENVRTVRLVMPEVTMQAKLLGRDFEYPALAGFGCANPTATSFADRFLLFRAFSAPGDLTASELNVSLTIVVDAIRLGGYPRCRVSELYSFCNEEGRDCAPIKAERVCFDLDPLSIPVTGNLARNQILENGAIIFRDYLRERLADKLVSSPAIDEEVMIRVVGTTESCGELEKKGDLSFERSQLVGCSYSCPVVPAAAKGEIILDLDAVVTAWCEPAVSVCASADFTLSEIADLNATSTRK